MSVRITKNIRVTGQAPFQETFAISNALVVVQNVKQTPYTGYSDYTFDIVYPSSALVATTSIVLNVTSGCGNASSYNISVASPCSSFSLGNVIRDANEPYRFSALAAYSSGSPCQDATFQWTYPTSLFEGTFTTRGLKSTLNLKLKNQDVFGDLQSALYKIGASVTDCNGCTDSSEATFSFCKSGFQNITKNLVVNDTSTYEYLYSIVSSKPNGYYISKDDGTLAIVPQPSTISNNNEVMVIGIEFREFKPLESCFTFDPEQIKFNILTTQYDAKYLGIAKYNSFKFHVFIAHRKYQEYFASNKAIEIEYSVESTNKIQSYPAKIILYPQSKEGEIGISFKDSQFVVTSSMVSPFDNSTVNGCNLTTSSVLYIKPSIDLLLTGDSYLNTSGVFGSNFFVTSNANLTVVPASTTGELDVPFLFKYTFPNTLNNTLPITIPYSLYATSKEDSNVKTYGNANLTIITNCNDTITLSQNTLSINLPCADLDDGTTDNIVYIDMSQYVVGTFIPSQFPIEVITYPTKGTFTIQRNYLQIKYVADVCQHGVFTAAIKLRNINGTLSNTFTITFNVDCVSSDYYARFCAIQ